MLVIYLLLAAGLSAFVNMIQLHSGFDFSVLGLIFRSLDLVTPQSEIPTLGHWIGLKTLSAAPLSQASVVFMRPDARLFCINDLSRTLQVWCGTERSTTALPSIRNNFGVPLLYVIPRDEAQSCVNKLAIGVVLASLMLCSLTLYLSPRKQVPRWEFTSMSRDHSWHALPLPREAVMHGTPTSFLRYVVSTYADEIALHSPRPSTIFDTPFSGGSVASCLNISSTPTPSSLHRADFDLANPLGITAGGVGLGFQPLSEEADSFFTSTTLYEESSTSDEEVESINENENGSQLSGLSSFEVCAPELEAIQLSGLDVIEVNCGASCNDCMSVATSGPSSLADDGSSASITDNDVNSPYESSSPSLVHSTSDDVESDDFMSKLEALTYYMSELTLGDNEEASQYLADLMTKLYISDDLLHASA